MLSRKIKWQTKKLGEVCKIIGGGTPSKSNKKFYVGNIPWATVRDMKSDLLDNTEFKISEEAVSCSSTNVIVAGNIIIASRVGLGKVCILQQDAAINQDLKAVAPRNNQLDKKFLFWWLKSVADFLEASGVGATVKGVRIDFINNLIIPVPSPKEQKRIVSILDQAFADIEKIRANTEKNLKNTRELFESYLQKVFSQCGEGWINSKLGDIWALRQLKWF
jgi:type I restriction enzyme, S subunit